GLVVKDQTTLYDGEGGATGTTQTGFAESFVYDERHRVIERRSRGWDAAADQDSDGLIHVFAYDDENPENPSYIPDNPGELIAEGIKQGVEGATFWLRRYHREIAGRPELITRETRYSVPATSYD